MSSLSIWFFIFFIFLGFGQPDVYYPKTFSGKWEVQQSYTEITENKESLYFVKLLKQQQSNYLKSISDYRKSNIENSVNIVDNNNKNNIENNVVKVEKNAEKNGNKKPPIATLFDIAYFANFIDYENKIILDRSTSETEKYNFLLSHYNYNKFDYKNENNKNSVDNSNSNTENTKNNQKDSQQNYDNLNSKNSQKIGFALGKWDYSNPNVLTVSTSDNKVSS